LNTIDILVPLCHFIVLFYCVLILPFAAMINKVCPPSFNVALGTVSQTVMISYCPYIFKSRLKTFLFTQTYTEHCYRAIHRNLDDEVIGVRTATTLGDRAFPIATSRAWNSLPPAIRTVSSFTSFRQQLKTLFRLSFG